MSQEVGKKGAEKKLTDFADRIEVVLKSRDEPEIKRLKVQLIEFISSLSIFYQAKKTDAQALLNRLESHNYQDTGNPSSTNPGGFPWKIVIPITLLVLTIIGIALVMVWKKRKEVKEEE